MAEKLPNFRTLHGSAPHEIARTQLNTKFLRLAESELGLTTVRRAVVPAELAPWSIDFPDYQPTAVDLPRGNTRARKPGDNPDPAHPAPDQVFTSLEGPILVDAHGYPLNPLGRTGVRGRMLLDKWG